MTTIDTLLHELGRPPRDICLDWAWQIQQLCHAQKHTADAIHLPLTWDSLEVNESGQLKLVRENSKSLSPDELLEQLMSWSASYAEQLDACDALPSASRSDLTSRLQALTRAAFDTDVAESKGVIVATSTPQRLAARSESASKLRRKIKSNRKKLPPGTNGTGLSRTRSLSLGISGGEGWGEGVESQESRPLTLSPEYKGEGTRKMLNAASFLPETRIRNRRLAALVIAVAAIIPMAFYLSSLLEVERGETQTTPSQAPSRALPLPLTNESTATHPAVVQNKRNPMQGNSPLSPPEISMSSPYGKAFEPNVTKRMGEEQITGQRLLSGVDLSLPQTITNAPNVDMDVEASARNLLAPTPALPGVDAENELTSTELSQHEWAKSETLATDVMAELASARNSADRLTLESELVATEETKGNISEPLLINTTPAVQIQKLPAKLATRPRQPVWRMAIAVDDEFTFSPSEPQALTERELATWVITSDDAKPPRTSLAVQVQMSSGRQAALKWQIFAATEDFPNLVLPLGEKILQPLQERLRQFTQIASQETERLKLLATSGVPSDLRTAINQQRAAIDTQGKLASRLLTFVASAQQLDNWLHGHVAVFAELRDGTTPDSTLVLRFGDLTDWAKTGANDNLQNQPEIDNPEREE